MADVNPYAPPVDAGFPVAQSADGVPEGVWRSGKTLVMHKQAPFPNRCLKTNEPTELRLKRNLSWHPPWVGFLVLIAVPVYIIVALILTQRATLQIPLSAQRLARRRMHILIAWLMVLAAVVLFSVGVVMASEKNEAVGVPLFISGFVLPIIALIYGKFAARMVWPEKIQGDYVYLRGVGPEFLATLAPLP